MKMTMPTVFYYIRFEKANKKKTLKFNFDFHYIYNILALCINILSQISIAIF